MKPIIGAALLLSLSSWGWLALLQQARSSVPGHAARSAQQIWPGP